MTTLESRIYSEIEKKAMGWESCNSVPSVEIPLDDFDDNDVAALNLPDNYYWEVDTDWQGNRVLNVSMNDFDNWEEK